jgi:predicted molibdopterin-dependent oxidoreductase YjgC
MKALYVVGENPMMSDPDLHHVEEALEKLDFLVVQDIFMSETAKYADVVLPTACFAEKEGTFSNTERRIQRVRKAAEAPGQARTDWEIISDLATRMGYPMQYGSAEEIFEEIRTVTPSYAGASYKRLEGRGLQWPVPSEESDGTCFLHKDGNCTRGKGVFNAIEYLPARELPDEEYPLFLTTGRNYYHYHTGTMTRRSSALDEFVPEGEVEINPALAGGLGVKTGDLVRLTTRRGTLEAKANVTERVPEGVVFMTFHFAETAVNLLTNADSLDPVAKIPEYKVAAVKVEKV